MEGTSIYYVIIAVVALAGAIGINTYLKRPKKGPLKKTDKNRRMWRAIDIVNQCRAGDCRRYGELDEILKKDPNWATPLGLTLDERHRYKQAYESSSVDGLEFAGGQTVGKTRIEL